MRCRFVGHKGDFDESVNLSIFACLCGSAQETRPEQAMRSTGVVDCAHGRMYVAFSILDECMDDRLPIRSSATWHGSWVWLEAVNIFRSELLFPFLT